MSADLQQVTLGLSSIGIESILPSHCCIGPDARVAASVTMMLTSCWILKIPQAFPSIAAISASLARMSSPYTVLTCAILRANPDLRGGATVSLVRGSIMEGDLFLCSHNLSMRTKCQPVAPATREVPTAAVQSCSVDR